jgi:hypothetical protein
MAALEERGRRFMADERRAIAAMYVVREANRQNAMRVASAASVAMEEAAAIAAEEAEMDAAVEAAATLEMTVSE